MRKIKKKKKEMFLHKRENKEREEKKEKKEMFLLKRENKER